MTKFAQVLQDRDWISFFKKWMLISLAIHIVCAFFSVGFYHFDEHFQILEFLNLKINGSNPGALPWEHHVKMRPWLQPWIYYVQAKWLMHFGITDRAIWTLNFRIFSTIIGWLSLCVLGFVSYFWTEGKWKKISIYFLSLFWFFPYIHARTSSDNLSATTFIIGAGLLLLAYPGEGKYRDRALPCFLQRRFSVPIWIAILVGFLFSLAFQFRYQMGVAILFFSLWCLLYGRLSYKSGLIMTASLILSLGFGVLVDSWGYGVWTFSPWNYLYHDFSAHIENTILPSPWWDYFRLLLLRGMPPISLILIIATLVFWIRKPLHPLTWITAPFFLIHMSISHKELRYVFIAVLLAPTMLVILSDRLMSWKIMKNRVIHYLILFFIAINMLLLLISSLKPANVSATFYRFVDRMENRPSKMLHLGEDPYTMLGYKMNFYRPSGLKTENLEDLDGLRSRIDREKTMVMTTRGSHLDAMEGYSDICKLEYLAYPKWLLKFNVSGWVQRSRIWALYNCQKF